MSYHFDYFVIAKIRFQTLTSQADLVVSNPKKPKRYYSLTIFRQMRMNWIDASMNDSNLSEIVTMLSEVSKNFSFLKESRTDQKSLISI